ncbi:hypothetical protein MTR67_035391 [Solanum verrucosum]|uniref:Gag-pol polyprotein n=1 Tax=Solanum verrucosum TaxID=315347 RepID=A0AAF0UA86_SOLVR|nr:hypothetical protein MTR67_035391 [Solanum verrucosum]
MTAQVNRQFMIPMSPSVGTAATRVSDFVRMNPLEFHGLKVDEDPQEFIKRTYKIVDIMGVTPIEKTDLDAY